MTLIEGMLNLMDTSWKGTYSQTPPSGISNLIPSRLNCPRLASKADSCLPVLQTPPGARDPAVLQPASHIFKSNKAWQLEFNCPLCWWGSRKISNYFRAYSCVGPNKCKPDRKAVAAESQQPGPGPGEPTCWLRKGHFKIVILLPVTPTLKEASLIIEGYLKSDLLH